METMTNNNQVPQTSAQSGSVDYAAALRQHNRYGRSRSMENIGSERSAADNAFMYSVIESCKLNDIDPGKYISYLLGKLKTTCDGDDLTGLLPCYCSL